MKLSVLDYGLIDHGKTAQEALQETVYLAKEAEKLGFFRFWVAEHHNILAFAISSPEILMTHIANQTHTIRVGSGGIGVLHASPYKIAELINTLEALHPYRIDIGLSSTQGTIVVHKAMKSPYQKSDYGDVLQQLHNYITLNASNSADITVLPSMPMQTPLFVLSNSEETAQKAGELGIGYTFGVFPYMQKDMEKAAKHASQTYRKHFKPSDQLAKPYLIFACFVIIADTAEKAEDLAQCLDIWMLGKNEFNEFASYPTVEQAKKYPLTEKEQQAILANRQRVIIGDAQQVKQQFDYFTALSGADEILAMPLMPNVTNRQNALQLLAKIY